MENRNRLDLIDRGKVLNEAFMVSMDGKIGYVVDREVICRLPRVDAVEVVRCKDCKFWKDDILRDDGKIKCCSVGYYMTKENDFCSFGKRREKKCI